MSVSPDTKMSIEALESGRTGVADLQRRVKLLFPPQKKDPAGDAADDPWNRLQEVLQSRLTDFEDHIGLAQAKSLFEDKKYEDCLKKLEAPLKSTALKKDAELLRDRAKFRQGVQAAGDPPDPSKIEALLKLYLKPPHAEDAKLHEDLCELLDTYRFDTELAQIRARYHTLPERIPALHQPVESYPKARAAAAKARKVLEEWLLEKVVVKRAPDVGSDFREALGKNGAYYFGYFELSTDYYKHWPTKEDSIKNPRAFRTILPTELEVQPGELTPVTCAKAYEKLRADLVRDFKSREAWQRFAEGCKKQQAILDTYAKGGGDRRDVDFAEVVKHVDDVLSVWEKHVQPLLEK